MHIGKKKNSTAGRKQGYSKTKKKDTAEKKKEKEGFYGKNLYNYGNCCNFVARYCGSAALLKKPSKIIYKFVSIS